MLKADLRKLFLEKRRSLTEDGVAEMSRLIADRFFAEFDLSAFRMLHCFISIAKFHEVDTSIFFRKIWQDFPRIQTLAPRIDRAADELEHLPYSADTKMNENAWGIHEPAGGKKADPVEIDLVIVPLLCFDDRGHRVGYGKGYYDRFLARCRPDCRKIGVSLFPPVDAIHDVHAVDVPLDACITPDRVHHVGGRN